MTNKRMNKKLQKQKEKDRDKELQKRERINEEQETEISSLQAIYQDDFQMLDSEDTYEFPKNFTIKVVPHPGQPELNNSWALLLISFSRNYPEDKLCASLRDFSPHLDTCVKEVHRLFEEVAECEKGYPAGYEVIMALQEFLVSRNQIIEPSMYEKMLKNREKEQLLRNALEEKRKLEHARELAEQDSKRDKEILISSMTNEKESEMRQKWLNQRLPSLGLDEKSSSSFTSMIMDDNSTSTPNEKLKENAFISHVIRKLYCAMQTSMPQIIESETLQTISRELVSRKLISSNIEKLLSFTNEEFSKQFAEAISGDGNEDDVTMISQLLAASYCGMNGFDGGLHRQSSLPESKSRYRKDFIEMETLGQGSFGKVVKVQHRVDGRFYAVKKIPIGTDPRALKRILREVATLSRLHHPFVLRYYQAWIETSTDNDETRTVDLDVDVDFSSGILHSDSLYHDELYDDSMGMSFGFPSMAEPFPMTHTMSNDESLPERSTFFLFIQTEYCLLSLRQLLSNRAQRIDVEENWRTFREILEGLAHIHDEGIIHRDLKPSNIFQDPSGSIRIGDLGLATFGTARIGTMSTFQGGSGNISSHCVEGKTTGIGTLMYNAPEIERNTGCSNHTGVAYSEKADMYSLGIICFELWFPFATSHERIDVLKALRTDLKFPDGFEESHPRQSELIRSLLQSDPRKRPGALEVLQSSLLPPIQEDAYLKDALRVFENPNSVFRQKLLHSLFHPALEQKTSSSVTTPQSSETIHSLKLREHLLECIRPVLSKFSFLEIKSPITLCCRGAAHEENGIAELIDRRGDKVDLRYDMKKGLLHRLNGMEMVEPNQQIRLFELGPVFRALKTQFDVMMNHEFEQLDLNIVGGNLRISESRILYVLKDIFQSCAASDFISVRIGHAGFIEPILRYCAIPAKHHHDVIKLLNSTAHLSEQELMKRISEGFGLGNQSRQNLMRFHNIHGKNRETFMHLKDIFNKDKNLLKIIYELEELLHLVQVLGIPVPSISMLTSSESRFDELVFRVFARSKKGSCHCIAVGGRYNEVIHSSKQISVCGASISMQTLCELLISNEDDIDSDENIRVFVASIGEDAFNERVKIAGELWERGISAEFSDDDKSLDSQLAEATALHVHWVVTAKEKFLQTTGMVRVRHIEKKQEFDVQRNELVKFFESSILSRKRH